MFIIPDTILTQYSSILKNNGIVGTGFADYKKWLRYYFDFCDKYPAPDTESERVRLFMEKLREKRQTEEQRKQAADAVSLYLSIVEQYGSVISSISAYPVGECTGLANNSAERSQWHDVSPLPTATCLGEELSQYQTDLRAASPRVPANAPTLSTHPPGKMRSSQYCAAGYEVKSDSPEWDATLGTLAAEIKVRHYSRKTLKTYANWSRQFQRFLKNKPPQELSTADVKEYLTYLAVKCNVAASTQNQAFNALLFLYRHALNREFGELRDVPRAKKSLYIPMVLSRPEIDAILKELSYPFNLVVKVLFGCGLRKFEGLQLRVRDFNFDDGMLTIHGKGKKDRTVPLPKTIMAELKAQFEAVGRLHDRDLAEGYDGVFLDDAVEKSIPRLRRSSHTSGSFRRGR